MRRPTTCLVLLLALPPIVSRNPSSGTACKASSTCAPYELRVTRRGPLSLRGGGSLEELGSISPNADDLLRIGAEMQRETGEVREAMLSALDRLRQKTGLPEPEGEGIEAPGRACEETANLTSQTLSMKGEGRWVTNGVASDWERLFEQERVAEDLMMRIRNRTEATLQNIADEMEEECGEAEDEKMDIEVATLRRHCKLLDDMKQKAASLQFLRSWDRTEQAAAQAPLPSRDQVALWRACTLGQVDKVTELCRCEPDERATRSAPDVDVNLFDPNHWSKVSGAGAAGERFSVGKGEFDRPGVVLRACLTVLHTIEVLLALLGAGADPYLTDKYGETVLHAAAREHHQGCVEILLKQFRQFGYDVCQRNDLGQTALMCALCWPGELDVRLMEKEEESGRTESLNRMVDILLAAEVDGGVNLADSTGFTALHYGARYNRTWCVQRLVAAGADVNAATVRGHTPLDWARESGQGTISVLISAGGVSSLAHNESVWDTYCNIDESEQNSASQEDDPSDTQMGEEGEQDVGGRSQNEFKEWIDAAIEIWGKGVKQEKERFAAEQIDAV